MMGGIGSSRWRDHVRKTLVDECMALDLRHTKVKALLAGDRAEGTLLWSHPRSGDPTGWADFLLAPVNSNGTRSLVLDVTGDEFEPKQLIVLSERPAGFSAHWFAGCRSCGAAVRTLFAVSQNDRFRCRICSDLTYRSVQQHDARVDWALRDPQGFFDARDRAPQTPNSQRATTWLVIRAVNRETRLRKGSSTLLPIISSKRSVSATLISG